jgi:anaerobic selenocysteine-containing dehydrogenase
MSEGDEQIHLRTCPLCESMCGLRIGVRNGHVTQIRPDEDDVWSRGYICPKGTTLGDLHHDPDRLRAPLVKRGGEFVEVGWDEAFEECRQRLQPVIEKYGIDAVTAYIGNPTAHNFSLGRYIGAFVTFSQLPVIYSAGTVDQWPKNLSSVLMYGGMWTIPTVDIDRTDFLIVMGANPHASQGSLLAAADLLGRMKVLQSRGGKIVVIDPRRTGTAERADEWIAIQPGTDAAFLMAILHVLFEENLTHPGRLTEHVNGLEKLRALARDWTPESVASTCRIPAESIRRLAREFAAAPRAALYGRIGTCTQEFGTLASWLVDVVNIVTGNFDRPGGAMFSNPISWSMVNLPDPQWSDGFELGRWRSRVRNAPEVMGQFPVSCLAEEIATPGDGQLKALITIAGNPVISAPDAGALDAALTSLECMISVDNWVNETTRHADVILPGLSPLEQPHYDELLWSWAVRNAGNFSPAIFEPDPSWCHEWEILIKLGLIVAGQKPAEIDAKRVDDLYFAGIVGVVAGMKDSRIAGRDPGEILEQAGPPGPERILDLSIRTGPWGDAYGERPGGLTLQSFRDRPHGIDKGPLESRIPEILRTRSGKIELTPPAITDDLPRLRARLGREDELVLVSRRHVRSNNSWMHNVPALVSGKNRCTLLVNPEDAQRLGLVDGGAARVRSAAGEVVAPVEVSDEMRAGVVSLPHGWGHDKPGTRLSVASKHAGVNNNLLAPGLLVDAISGNAVVNGIPVEVSPSES